MAWLQLRITGDHPEFTEEILLAQGAVSVSFMDAEDRPVLEPAPGETPLWERTVVLGLFPEHTELAPVTAALRELLPDGAALAVQTELVEDQDWVRVWLKHWRPLKFGERLWVAPHEKIGEIEDPQAVILELDPGLAFGTGTHPTTALCLDWLARQDLAGKTVLDYGCGSGILAIAALKLGAARAVCVDIDPQALTATRDNARINGVAAQVGTLLPDRFVPFPADIVIANILARPLIDLAPLLASSIRSGGRIVLAGLLERQQDEVRAAYAPWFTFEPDQVREGWTRLAASCRLPAIIALHRFDGYAGTAGQPQALHFPLLAQQGYTHVVNLATAQSPNFLEDEPDTCAQCGLRYTHLPVDWKNPTRKNLDDFFALMSSENPRMIFVHCAMNKRVSAFVFLHRVIGLGVSVEVASQDLHRIWQPDPVWATFIARMLDEHGIRHV